MKLKLDCLAASILYRLIPLIFSKRIIRSVTKKVKPIGFNNLFDLKFEEITKNVTGINNAAAKYVRDRRIKILNSNVRKKEEIVLCSKKTDN